jgi:hypothetical protein
MRIRIECGLHSRSTAGFWKNDRAAVRAVRTIQCNNLLFYLLFIILYDNTHGSGNLREDCTHGRHQEIGVDISWTTYL